jgi:hypothetical protein
MEIEAEGFAGLDGMSVEMPGTENEGSGPVGEPAGAVAESRRFEDTRVRAGVADVTGPGVGAMRDAGDFAEDHTQRAAQNVRGFARRKEERLLCDELEP